MVGKINWGGQISPPPPLSYLSLGVALNIKKKKTKKE